MTPEPFMVPDTDEFVVPCPYCHEQHTHQGTCRLSFASTGHAYVIIARRVDIVFPNPVKGAVK